jgi:hypothetical protein
VPTIRIKRGSGAPISLEAGELAFDGSWGHLYAGLQVGQFTTTYLLNRQSPIHGYWEAPVDQAYPICLKMDRAEQKLTLYAQTSSGTCNLRFRLGATTLLGSGTLSVSSSAITSQTVTGISGLTTGSSLYLVVSGSSSPEGLAWSVHFG